MAILTKMTRKMSYLAAIMTVAAIRVPMVITINAKHKTVSQAGVSACL
jgi:hypothetical protein